MIDPDAPPTVPEISAPGKPSTGVGIDIRNLRRVFDSSTVAIEKLDLGIGPGEFVAILGPSGCGKSTLLRIIADLDRPTSGSVEIRGSLQNARGRGVAYVFQDAHLLPWRRVIDNVALPQELLGVSRSQRREAAMNAIERVGLAEAAGRYPAQLSGGMRMRVSLARALITDPKLLLLDEPFAALDEITRQQLDEQLRDLWMRSGMTVLFVTHSIGEATFLAERAVVLSRRPARVMLDHRLSLGAHRTAELRASAEFARETGILFEALRRGGAY